MVDYLEFMKQLFFAMLYLTGIIACFVIMISLLETTIGGTKRHKSNAKIINLDSSQLSEETKKELENYARKIANEVLSDEYDKED